MRLDQLLLGGLIICSLAMPAGFAEDEIPAESAAPTPVPATPVPATPVPVTEAPATEIPATPVPATEVPATQIPETQTPATEVPVTEAPATQIPETQTPATEVPVTEAPTTQVPETQAPSASPEIEPTESAAPGDAPGVSPSADATLAPSQEPGIESTAEPTTAPTFEPTAEPTVTPSKEPTAAPSAEPSIEPSLEPSASPSAEPTTEPTPDPSLEPSVSPSVSPSPTPLPLPGAIDGLVAITPEGGALQASGVWSIQLAAPASPLVFAWTVNGEALNHLVYVQDALGAQSFIGETADARIELASANYTSGQYTLYVGAVLADGSVTWGSATFEVAAQQGGFPGGMGGLGGFGGGRPSASMGGAGMMPQEEQGFRVTPGEALTSKHSSGSMDTTAYTHSDIEATPEAMTALVLSSTQAQITLDGGEGFFLASVEDDRLSLTPEAGGDTWQLSALAMNTLQISGINRVVFHLDNSSWSLPTQMHFTGGVYASLRAQGYVEKDMTITIGHQGMHLTIAGGIYTINESGELVPFEG